MSPVYRNPAEPRDFDLEMDGRRCRVLPLGAKASRDIAVRLLGVIGKSIRQATSSGAHPALLDVTSLGYILEELAQTGQLEELTTRFLPTTQVETSPGTDEFMPLAQLQDLLFAGEGMGRWLRWLAFCLEVHTASFFAESRQLGPQLKAKYMPTKASPSQTSSPSTGSSIGS